MATERRKKCKFCGDLFRPHRRVGDRQRACSKKACKADRAAAAKAAWREAHPDYCLGRAGKHRAYRAELKRRLAVTAPPAATAAEGGGSGVPRPPERDAIPAQATTPQRLIPLLMGDGTERDAILAQGTVLIGLAASLGGSPGERDTLGARVAMLHNLGRRFSERAVLAAARTPHEVV